MLNSRKFCSAGIPVKVINIFEDTLLNCVHSLRFPYFNIFSHMDVYRQHFKHWGSNDLSILLPFAPESWLQEDAIRAQR